MTILQNSLAVILVVVGVSMMFIGSLGVIRLPDFFSRTHASSKVDTVGIIILLSGLMVYEGFTLAAGKLLLAILFIALTNPVAIHILARAAIRMGVKPWRKSDEKEERAS